MRQKMMGFWDGGGISWTICNQSALHSRQITTPAPHHSMAEEMVINAGDFCWLNQ